MDQFIQDNGNKGNYKDLDYLFGLIKENIKVFEKKIVCIEKKFIHGKTVENIKENIEWTKNKEKEFINTLMEEFMMDNGLKVNNMGKEKLSIQMVQ